MYPLDTSAVEPTVARWLISNPLLSAAGLYAYAMVGFRRHGSLPSLRQRGLIRDHHPTLVAAPPSYALGTILWAGGRLLYPDYAEVSGIWALTPLADRQLGGLFMWLQGWMFLMVSMAIFFVWYDPELEQA